MSEEEERYNKMAEALNQRKVAREERDRPKEDVEQQRRSIELRLVEVEFVLEENRYADAAPLSLVIYRQGDDVAVIDCVNQDLCREVLERILKEDKEKLAQL